MTDKKHSVNGSWLGNYYYEKSAQSFGFEAVFMEANGSVEGSILDDGGLGEANLFGVFNDPHLSFTKKYHNSAHAAIVYEGTMTDDGKRLDGNWRIPGVSGTWVAWRQTDEEIPPLSLESTVEQEEEQEKVFVRRIRRPKTDQQQREL